MNKVEIRSNPLLIRSLTDPLIMRPKKKVKIAFTAGLGAGKTFALVQRHHYLCTVNSKSNFSCFFLPIYEKIFSSTIPTYKKVLALYGYSEGRDFKIIKSPFPKLIYRNGHEVHFHSANRPEMIQAVEYSHASMDETASCSEDAALAMDDRVRDGKAEYLQSSYGGVPVGLNFYADLFDSDTQKGWRKITNRFYYNEEFERFRFKLSIFENPHLPKDYIAGLERNYKFRPSLLRAFVYGEFTANIDGVACPSYNPAIHDDHTIEADPYQDLNFCWDFNYSPLSWVVIQKQAREEYYTRRYPYFILQSSAGKQKNIKDACIEFAFKFPPERFKDTPINVYGDRTGHSKSHKYNRIDKTDYDAIKEELYHLGYRQIEIVACKRVVPEAESIDAVDKLFHNNMIFLHPYNAEKMKDSLLRTETIPGERKILKPSGDKDTWTHWFDALKYFCWQVAYYDTGTKIYKPQAGTNLI